MASTWLITGATSGFGRLVAERLLTSGARVIAVGRRRDLLDELAAAASPDQLVPLVLDVTSERARSVLEGAIQAVGGIDVLFNNAGTGVYGAVEQISIEDARATFEVNVFAALTVLHASLPALRSRQGRVIQMSSNKGRYADPSSGLYSATKAAVTLLSEALAMEVAPLGVKVTIVEPGLAATDFAARCLQIPANDVYAPSVGAYQSQFARLSTDAMIDPADVADAIVAVAAMDSPPLHLPLGDDAIAGIRDNLLDRLAELAPPQETTSTV